MTPSFHPRLVNGRYGDPALFVDRAHERGALLFDLGDLHPLSARDLLRVTHAFVSHMHMDHFVGFDSWLRVLVGREKQVDLVGPEGLIDAVGHKLRAYTWDLVSRYDTDLVIDVAELVAPDRLRRARYRFLTGFAREELGEADAPGGLVARTPAFSVHAAILEHHGPSLGFALTEPVHVNVWRNRVEERGLAVGPWLKPLKEAIRDGAPDDTVITLPDGTAELGTLRDLVSVEPGQKLGYITDIRDTPANRAAVAALCDGADTLFIEASFAADEAERARDRAHLTTTAAGEIARAAQARRVEPFHFSSRNEGREAEMLLEVEAAFAPTPLPLSRAHQVGHAPGMT
ncbi:ribonuclease Z [Sphingomonas lenta]|uniref:ribonuclease Z n=1 Tax=Sphingomonas lenta TaxID=1141887 RepID=UPI0015955862|nr:MBL fold metallo-hydrolase [Sphingomonas lenta]